MRTRRSESWPGDRPLLQKSLPAACYTSDAFFREEREKILLREWFVVGREEFLPRPGDYLVLDVVGESVLVVRTQVGTLKAFYNVCRHRGARLCLGTPVEPGRTDRVGPTGHVGASIRCPYHSWTYRLDGALLSAPFLSEWDVIKKADLGLHPIGLDTWGGFVFLNLSPEEAMARGHTLRHQLGAVPERLKRYPLPDLRVARRIVYDVQANWKVVAENYNECYHCGPVHPELCEIVPAFKKDGGANLTWDEGVPHREGAFPFTWTGTTNRAPFPRLSEEEKVRHKGELVYPNFMISLSPDHVAAFLLWPKAVDRTTVVCDFLLHPDEMAKPTFDPSDAVDFWDLINRQDWAVCERVQQGMQSRVFRFGYYAPMEDMSLDIRTYIASKLGIVPEE